MTPAGSGSTSGSPAVRRSRTAMQLPFRGEWYVFWGGENEKVNYHASTPGQRRAADLLIKGAGELSHKGAGRRNEDYFVYGKEILAAGAGTVVTAVDGVPDNQPGSMNPLLAVGNCLIIDQGSNEYAVYAHLKPDSLRVHRGDKVRVGQVLASAATAAIRASLTSTFICKTRPPSRTAQGSLPISPRSSAAAALPPCLMPNTPSSKATAFSPQLRGNAAPITPGCSETRGASPGPRRGVLDLGEGGDRRTGKEGHAGYRTAPGKTAKSTPRGSTKIAPELIVKGVDQATWAWMIDNSPITNWCAIELATDANAANCRNLAPACLSRSITFTPNTMKAPPSQATLR